MKAIFYPTQRNHSVWPQLWQNTTFTHIKWQGLWGEKKWVKLYLSKEFIIFPVSAVCIMDCWSLGFLDNSDFSSQNSHALWGQTCRQKARFRSGADSEHTQTLMFRNYASGQRATQQLPPHHHPHHQINLCGFKGKFHARLKLFHYINQPVSALVNVYILVTRFPPSEAF